MVRAQISERKRAKSFTESLTSTCSRWDKISWPSFNGRQKSPTSSRSYLHTKSNEAQSIPFSFISQTVGTCKKRKLFDENTCKSHQDARTHVTTPFYFARRTRLAWHNGPVGSDGWTETAQSSHHFDDVRYIIGQVIEEFFPDAHLCYLQRMLIGHHLIVVNPLPRMRVCQKVILQQNIMLKLQPQQCGESQFSMLKSHLSET